MTDKGGAYHEKRIDKFKMQRDDDDFNYDKLPSEKIIAAVKRVLKEPQFTSIDRLERNEILKMILEDHEIPAGPRSAVGAASGRDETIDRYMRLMIIVSHRKIIRRRAARRSREQMEEEEEEDDDDDDDGLDYTSGSRLNTKLQRDIRQMERVGAMVDRKLMKLRRDLLAEQQVDFAKQSLEEAGLSKHL